MFPYDYLAAAALLAQSPDLAVPAPGAATFESLRQPLQTVAADWEVLDPREARYVLARIEDFPSDLSLLRRRQRELADAPPVRDADRFPDRAVINDLLTFNRSYRQHLDDGQALETSRWWEARTALQETDHLYYIWDTARDARCEYYYVTVRRQALKRLRDMVGEDAYSAARLPPHVPLWRFQEIR